MRFLYISRDFNRSGYHVLEHLLRTGAHRPIGVILPASEHADPLDDPDPAVRAAAERAYRERAQALGGPPLRFMRSIRRLAAEAGVPVHDRRTLKGAKARQWLAELDAELLVLGGGWPQLLPEKLVAMPPLGVINTHPSLLPEFRGTDVHRWQVAHGARRSGTTIHYVDETFDTGAILGSVAIDVDPAWTPQELALQAGIAAGPLMERVLDDIAEAAPGRVAGRPQEGRGDADRYHSRWRWDDPEFLRLDTGRPAEELARFVRACAQQWYGYEGPWLIGPDGRRRIVREATALPAAIPGDAWVLRCGEGALRLDVVQRPSDPPPHTTPAERPAATNDGETP